MTTVSGKLFHTFTILLVKKYFSLFYIKSYLITGPRRPVPAGDCPESMPKILPGLRDVAGLSALNWGTVALMYEKSRSLWAHSPQAHGFELSYIQIRRVMFVEIWPNTVASAPFLFVSNADSYCLLRPVPNVRVNTSDAAFCLYS